MAPSPAVLLRPLRPRLQGISPSSGHQNFSGNFGTADPRFHYLVTCGRLGGLAGLLRISRPPLGLGTCGTNLKSNLPRKPKAEPWARISKTKLCQDTSPASGRVSGTGTCRAGLIFCFRRNGGSQCGRLPVRPGWTPSQQLPASLAMLFEAPLPTVQYNRSTSKEEELRVNRLP